MRWAVRCRLCPGLRPSSSPSPAAARRGPCRCC